MSPPFHLIKTLNNKNKEQKKKNMTNNQHDQTRVLYQLCSMIINILGSPPLPIPFPTTLSGPTLLASAASSSSSSVAAQPRVSTAGFAGLFIVVSFAMMMFGTAIFVIGFMLMPLVVGLVFLFYLAGVVSNVTYLAAAVISPPSRVVSAWRLS